MVAFVPPEEAAPPAPDLAPARSYTFRVLCASGEFKDFNFQASDFLQARQKLAELIEQY